MKYLIKNDISYIIKKRFLLLLGYALFIVIICGLTVKIKGITSLDVINISLGTHFDISNFGVYELYSLVLSIAISILLVIELYTKDLKYQIDNVFLRMDPNKWYMIKTTMFSIFIIIIKIVLYSLLIIINVLFNKDIIISEVLLLFTCDVLFTWFIQFFVLMVFILAKIFKKNWIMILLGILLVMPFSIWSYRNKLLLLLGGIIIIHLINYLLITKKNKQLF